MIPPQLTSLKKEILQRGISAQAIASHLGVTRHTVYRWFMDSKGHRNPSLKKLAMMEAFIYSHPVKKSKD